MECVGVILGGGVKQNGALPEHVKKRLKKALLHSSFMQHVIFSSRYTLNKPQTIDKKGFVVTEAAAMAKYFQKKLNIKDINMYLELASTDTIGSALYTRSLLENIGIKNGNLIIFTSDWHSERAEYIFKWAFSLRSENRNVEFSVNSISSDSEIKPFKRVAKESEALKNFKIQWESIISLTKAWNFLYKNHDNYNLNNKSLDINYDGLQY